MYMESIGDARSFLSAAREVSLTQADHRDQGRTHRSRRPRRRLAHRHAHRQRRSAGRRVPPLRRAARQHHRRPVLHGRGAVEAAAPKGPRLAIVTNAGGPGVLATDSIIAAGGELAELSPATMEQLNQILPPHWSHNNPVDILGDALPDTLRQGAGNRRRTTRTMTGCWPSLSAGHDGSDHDRRAARALRQGPGQAGARQLDGRRRDDAPGSRS